MPNRIRELRDLQDLTLDHVAGIAGTTPQQISKLEKGERRLTTDWMERIAPAFGVDPAELLAKGLRLGKISRRVIEGAAEVIADLPPDPARPSILIPEYDVRPMGGDGGADIPEPGEHGHVVVGMWSMPRALLSAFAADPDAVRVIQVAGDSMEPDYPAGERLMVDTSHRVPSPDGIYVLWDGYGLILKRIALVPGVTPRRVRIMSINPDYPTHEVAVEDIHINGRVIGRWQWR